MMEVLLILTLAAVFIAISVVIILKSKNNAIQTQLKKTQNDLSSALQREEKAHEDIIILREREQSKQAELRRAEENYQQQIRLIKNAQKQQSDLQSKVDDEQEKRSELLNQQYELKRSTLQQEFATRVGELETKLTEYRDDLASMKNTRSAMVEAFQRERLLQQQNEYYHLGIAKDKLQDIQLLRSIQFKLSTPRILSMLIWQNFYQPVAKKNFVAILGKDNVCGIYKITSMATQMCYIGQAKNMYRRWTEHCKCGLGIDTPQGNKLYQAMLDEGLENFTFELLEKCSEDELNEKEQFYIQTYNSVAFGFNGNKGVNIG